MQLGRRFVIRVASGRNAAALDDRRACGVVMLRMFLRMAVILMALPAHNVMAQDIGITIFDSANTAAINIAGTKAMNAAISSSFNRLGPGRPPATLEIDTSRPVQLDFRPDPAVTQTVNARFVDLLGSLQPDRRDQIASELDSGALQTRFSTLLSSYGYSSGNLADVMTAYLVIAWEVVHNKDATSYLNGIGIVHNGMRSALSHSPNVRDLSDAQRQEVAETLGNLTMLAAVARSTLVQRGDTDSLVLLQENVLATTRKFGIDLAAVRLTDEGFVPL
jgi:uncharacterized protein DUF6683